MNHLFSPSLHFLYLTRAGVQWTLDIQGCGFELGSGNRSEVCQLAGWWPHSFPQGLEDVSTYPVLSHGLSEEELKGVLRGNLLQVFLSPGERMIQWFEQVRGLLTESLTADSHPQVRENSEQSPGEDEFPDMQVGSSCHSHPVSASEQTHGHTAGHDQVANQSGLPGALKSLPIHHSRPHGYCRLFSPPPVVLVTSPVPQRSL